MDAKAGSRTRLAIVACALVTLLVATACIGPNQTEVLNALNQDRQAHGLRALPIQNEAQAKAQAWAEKLARENRLYHSELTDGFGPGWCSLGENVGKGPTLSSVHHAFMNSGSHKANILGSWHRVGTGVHRQGDVVWVTEIFLRNC